MSKLLSMLMSSSGGGVEFKTSIYATGNAYILLPKNFTEVYGMRVKGSFRNFGSNGWRTFCGYYYQDTYAPYPSWSGLTYNYYSASNFYMSLKIGTSGTTVNSTTANMNFDLTSKTTTTQLYSANVSIPLFAFFNGSSYVPNVYSNNMWNIEKIELYDNLENKIADLVPAIVNGECGLYDTITETFYGNANSVGSLVCE